MTTDGLTLVKVTCEVRFSERIKLLHEYEAMHLELLKQEPKNADKWLAPGLTLRDEERKRIMIIEQSRCVVDIERPPNLGFSKDLVLQFFQTLEKHFTLPPVSRWGIRTTWIKEYKGTFSELLDSYKSRIFGNSEMAKVPADIGVVFDYFTDDKKVKLSLTTGPMESRQLEEQFLPFKSEGSPPLFVYADVDASDTQTKRFSSQHLGTFFALATSEGEKLAVQMVHALGE